MINFNEKTKRWHIEIDRRVSDGETKARLRKTKVLPKNTTMEEAQAIAHSMEAALVKKTFAVSAQHGWVDYANGLLENKGSWLHASISKMKNRAVKIGKPFSMNAHSLHQAMIRTMGRCEITGLRFTSEQPTEGAARPYFHSVDRIDSRLGYTPDNIRIVCFAVNMAMSNWGDSVFAEICTGFVFNKYSAVSFNPDVVKNSPTRS